MFQLIKKSVCIGLFFVISGSMGIQVHAQEENKILPGIYVENISLGGKSAEEAQKELSAYVDELSRMGADIRVEGRVAVVCGVERLSGARLLSTDLRGGAALAVAALGAEGESILSGLKHVDRGYTDLALDLRALGAKVVRNDETVSKF